MLVAAVAVVLIGMAAMLAIAGRIAEDRLDDRVEEVNRDFDQSLNRFRDEVRRELDGRVPTTPTPTPTPFPTTTPTPTPSPSPEGEGTATPSPTTSPDAEATPTETPLEEIRP